MRQLQHEVVERALAAADVDACVSLARDLVRIPSVTGDERKVQERVAAAMKSAGLEVDFFEADLEALGKDPRFPGMEVDRSEAVLAAGTIGPADGRSLILNGHVDVVPVGTRGWSHDPFAGVVEGGRLQGRGSCDMKSGVAVAISVAAALEKSGLELAGRLVVESVVGEEDGGVGTFAMIRRGYTADAAVVLEPTNLALVVAQGGALTFRLTVGGRAAHAAVRYEGESAFERFLPIHDDLRELERELNSEPHPRFGRYPIPYPLSFGIVRAGEWSATVPDRLAAEGRVGVPVGVSSEVIRRRVEQVVGDRALVEWFGGQFDSAEVDSSAAPFVLLERMHRDVTGSGPPVEGVPYGSDMRLLVNEAGIPAVLYGPGDIRVAHQVDESISIDEIATALRVVTATAATYLAAG